MDSKFKAALEMVVRKYIFERDVLHWFNLPLLRRIFTRKPVDPFPGKSIHFLAQEMCKSFGERFSKDGCCCLYMDWQRKVYLPVLIFKGWYHGCCFMSRKAFDFDGTYLEWGCYAPYDECGLSALPSEHNINDAADLEKAFKDMIPQISETIRDVNEHIARKGYNPYGYNRQ